MGESIPGGSSNWRPGAGTDLPVLAGLQYLRAVAAIAVVIDHVGSNAGAPKYFGVVPFGGLLGAGRTGVDLFFVLSGFIMAYINLGPDLSPRRTPGRFARERAARLAPLLWLVVLVYAALRLVGFGGYSLWDCLRAATLFPIGTLAPNVVWTLQHEALFYALFCATYLWRIPGIVLWAWFAAPVVLELAGAHFGRGAGGTLLALVFDDVNLEFGAGFAVGLVLLRAPRLAPRRWALAMLLASAGAVFLAAGLAAGLRNVLEQRLLLAVLGGVAVWAAAGVGQPGGWLGRTTRFLGDASYSLYLTHSLVLSTLLPFLVRRQLALLPSMAVLALASIGFGALVYWACERRLVGLARRVLGLGRRGTAAGGEGGLRAPVG